MKKEKSFTRQNFLKKNLGGFTLIELLVVIAIISLLSSIVLVSLSKARERARYTRAQLEMSQIMKKIELVRQEQDKVLKDITAPGTLTPCSDCVCRGRDLSSFPNPNDECILNMTVVFQRLGLPLMKDPWGVPYLIDENEEEFGQCRKDTINSAGPDKFYPDTNNYDENTHSDNDGPKIKVFLYRCK